MDELMQEFLTDTTEKLGALDLDLVRLEKNPNDLELIGRIFRLVHTVKGNCGFLGLPRLENVAHHAESVLSQYRAGTLQVTTDSVSLILQSLDRIKGIVGGVAQTGVEPAGDDRALIGLLNAEAASRKQLPEAVNAFSAAMDDLSAKSLRIGVDTLEDMMTLMGELVLARNLLLPHMRGELHQPLQRLDKTVSALQQSMLKARMQPVGNLWSKLPRLVRDMAIDLGKKNPAGDAGRRDRNRPAGAGADPRPADASAAQRRRPRHRKTGRARRERQAARRRDFAGRAARRRAGGDRGVG